MMDEHLAEAPPSSPKHRPWEPNQVKPFTADNDTSLVDILDTAFNSSADAPSHPEYSAAGRGYIFFTCVNFFLYLTRF